VLASAEVAARRTIEEHARIELSARDSLAFAEALLNPKPVSERLRETVRRYYRAIGVYLSVDAEAGMGAKSARRGEDVKRWPLLKNPTIMRRKCQMASCTTRRPAFGLWLIPVLLLMFCGAAQAQELEGTWKLVMRKLPDGATQVPPAVEGAATWHNGLHNIVVFGRTPEGKPFSFSLISNYKISSTEWTETLLVSVRNPVGDKPSVYNTTMETKTVPLTGEGQRIAFDGPFEAASFVFDGDKMTATLKNWVDTWERVR
jgi:hypothetical protein